ncbi:hypothetical protein QCA50_007997 [Cerrena zonata]|uniref:Uncharacterized protein n=1 Tax=Cerrena zonata TaxID=2478898 RepID=A0AAW0GAZ0_9APHY
MPENRNTRVQPSATRWLSSYQYRRGALQQQGNYEQGVLRRLGVLIEYVMHEHHTNERERLEFVWHLRLCFESMPMWTKLEQLFIWARGRWPLLDRALMTSNEDNIWLSDILHNAEYLQACTEEVLHRDSEVVGSSQGLAEDGESEVDDSELPDLITPDVSDDNM